MFLLYLIITFSINMNKFKDYKDFLEDKSFFNWRFYCTGTTAYTLTTNSAIKLMNRFHHNLKTLYESEIKIFYVSEPFDLKDGCHVHFMIDCASSITIKDIYSCWNNAANKSLGRHRIVAEPYIYGLGGSNYYTKYLNRRNVHHDFL